jgi:hypothetical protein
MTQALRLDGLQSRQRSSASNGSHSSVTGRDVSETLVPLYHASTSGPLDLCTATSDQPTFLTLVYRYISSL